MKPHGYITGIDKRDGCIRHLLLRGFGPVWKDELIRQIERDGKDFYTLSKDATGKEVMARIHVVNGKYLRTDRSEIAADDLGSLPLFHREGDDSRIITPRS